VELSRSHGFSLFIYLFQPTKLDQLEIELCVFFYIKLSQSYEQNHGFNMLSRVDLVCFFNLFFILSLNIGLVEN
jgi:hypothetical protein